MKLTEVPPFEDLVAVTGMEGKIAQGRVAQRIDLVKWSRRKEVRGAWARIAVREGLEKDALEKATPSFPYTTSIIQHTRLNHGSYICFSSC